MSGLIMLGTVAATIGIPVGLSRLETFLDQKCHILSKAQKLIYNKEIEQTGLSKAKEEFLKKTYLEYQESSNEFHSNAIWRPSNVRLLPIFLNNLNYTFTLLESHQNARIDQMQTPEYSKVEQAIAKVRKTEYPYGLGYIMP